MTTLAVPSVRRRDPQQMLQDVGRGSRIAFAALYDEMAPLVHGICSVIVQDPAAAEQATENAFIAVWRLAPWFRPDQHDATRWILQHAWNAAADSLQRPETGAAATDRGDRRKPAWQRPTQAAHSTQHTAHE